MKTRESGMPAEEMWRGFFDPETALCRLGLVPECERAVDFGCGYGTFSVPAAQIIRGTVHSLDIDPEMVERTRVKAGKLGLENLRVSRRDFVETGSGLDDVSADYVMLFNILHAAEAAELLKEAKRILKPDGVLAVMHWNHDASTPRGPDMAIRPRPEHCLRIVEEAGFTNGPLIDLPPYHYGFTANV